VGVSAAPWYCGDRQVVHPDRVVNPGGRPPLAIGDSVMLPTVFRLAHAGYKADARGCRTMGEGLRIMRRVKRNRGGLPHLVVVALGAGWPVSGNAIRAALAILGPGTSWRWSHRTTSPAPPTKTAPTSSLPRAATPAASSSSTGSGTAKVTAAGSSPTAPT
jgi:hypothetical protein